MIENLHDLKYFLEVAKTGNLTRASERLGVTQPSLTLAINRLEARAGIRLLERNRRGSSLTRQGKALVALGERMMKDWERELKQLSQSHQEPVGKYSLGIHVNVALYTIEQFVPQLVENFPELELNFLHDLFRNITEKIISRDCDFGLVMNPVPHPDLVLQKILTDEVTLFQHPQYSGNVLIYDPALIQSQFILKQLKKSTQLKREIYSSSLEVIRKLALAKTGVAILPRRVAEGLAPITGAPVYKDELFLAYRMERKAEPSFKAIIQTIKNCF